MLWCDNNNLQLSASKIREMIVDFCKEGFKKTSIAPIIINGEPIERVDCLKFLGTIIYKCSREKGQTKAVLAASTKIVRAE